MAASNGRRIGDSSDASAACRGDVEAFGRLAAAHTGLVHTVVRDHVRTPDDVADCVQECFAQALRTVHRLRDPHRFPSWLASIARHVAIDHRRRRARELTLSAASPERVQEMVSSRPSPETVVTRRQLRETVRAHVRAMPDREAAAVHLVTYRDQGPAEVAAELGVSHGNAKVIVHRARRRLRSMLVEDAFLQGQLACEELDRSHPGSASDHLDVCLDCQRQARQSLLPVE